MTPSGQRRMENDTEGSLEVEGFSPSESPEADISVVEDHGGPESHQFKPLAPAPVHQKVEMSKAGALGAEANSVQERMVVVSEW